MLFFDISIVLGQEWRSWLLTRLHDVRCKGVRRVPFIALTLAPCSSNNSIVSTCPKDVARCKGVEWVSSCAFTSAPCLSKTWTVLLGDLRKRLRCSFTSTLCWIESCAFCHSPDSAMLDAKACCDFDLLRRYPPRAAISAGPFRLVQHLRPSAMKYGCPYFWSGQLSRASVASEQIEIADFL